MNALLAEVKSRVTVQMFADKIGLRQNRAGFCVCPFHPEKTPSLKIYGNNSWHCFGCHQGGDVIDMARLYYGCGFQEALKALAADFGISNDNIKKRGSEALKAAVGIAINNLTRRKADELKRAKESKFWHVFDLWLANERKIRDNVPADMSGEWNEEFCEGLNNRAVLDWRLACAEDERGTAYARD